jgi:hypothetical protein
VLGDLESFLQTRGEAAGVRRPRRRALGAKKIGQEEGIWDAALLPEVQDVEARLVARPASLRCTGVHGISRRSSCPRQRDPVEDGRRALEKKKGRNLVRGMRQNMVKKIG